MTNRVPSETRRYEHEGARIYTGENEIYLNKRSVFSQLFLWLVIIGCVVTALVATTGAAPIVVDDVPLELNPEPLSELSSIFKPAGDAVPDKNVEQILAWIKTKNPEWENARVNLSFYLASQEFIDKWMDDEYESRKEKGWPVPEYFKEPGRTAAFFTEIDGRYYIYLPLNFDISELIDEDTLVHELVHYVQRINGVEAACQGDREFSAHFFVILYLLEVKGVAADSETVIWNMNEAADYICDSD
jgi:hypothetical protein